MSTAAFAEPAVNYPIPVETNFDEENEYYHDARLEGLASDLIDRYPHLFAHLINEKVAYLWKRKGPKKRDGSKLLGKTSKANGLLYHFGEVGWVIWLAAEACRELDFTDREVEAALFSYMCRLGYDPEKGVTFLQEPDFTGFLVEVKEYGLWHSNLRKAGEQFQQLNLRLN